MASTIHSVDGIWMSHEFKASVMAPLFPSCCQYWENWHNVPRNEKGTFKEWSTFTKIFNFLRGRGQLPHDGSISSLTTMILEISVLDLVKIAMLPKIRKKITPWVSHFGFLCTWLRSSLRTIKVTPAIQTVDYVVMRYIPLRKIKGIRAKLKIIRFVFFFVSCDIATGITLLPSDFCVWMGRKWKWQVACSFLKA